MSGKGGAFRYVKPPKRLMEKVGTQGGVEIADALVKADAAIAKIAEDFPEICEGWIKELEDVLAKTEGELDSEMKERLLHVANDIRGQGGTFGYPASVTAAGLGRLRRYARAHVAGTMPRVRANASCVCAMAAIQPGRPARALAERSTPPYLSPSGLR